MAKLNFQNKWVLITGASSGLGRAIALLMARKEKAHLVLVARRTDRLVQLQHEIQASCPSKVKIITADLNQPEEVENLFKQAVEMADIFAVINNAGFTFYGKASALHLETFEKILNVTLKAVVILTLRFLAYFEQKGEGAILNVTSEAALITIPYQAFYTASKHAAQVFTEALRLENRKSKVVISSFAPGGIATEMLTNAGLDKKHKLDSPFNMSAEKAAKLAVKAFKKKKFYSVPGWMNKVSVFLTRFFPRKVAAACAEIAFRPKVSP